MNAPRELRDGVVDALAAYRLTRLASKDVILDHPRAWLIRKAYAWRDGMTSTNEAHERPSYWQMKAEDDDDAPKLAELVTCRWCVGMWISFGTIAARHYAPVLWDPVARALALSAAAALVARVEDE